MKTETGGRLLYLQITNYRPRKLPPDILSLLRGEHPPIFLDKPIEFLVLFQTTDWLVLLTLLASFCAE